MKKLFAVKDFAQKQFLFLLRWPLEAKPLTLGQIWRNLSYGELNFLSNAVFGFVLAIIVLEIMKLFRNDVWQSRKTRQFGHFWLWGPQFWLKRKIDWNSFEIIFEELSNAFFRFSLRLIGAEIDGDIRPPPLQLSPKKLELFTVKFWANSTFWAQQGNLLLSKFNLSMPI